jgi:hypothetical protein
MAGQSKDIGIGDANLEGGNLIGGPLGGPMSGRPGKRLETPQQAGGDWTGPGVPVTPLRGHGQPQVQRSKGSPKNPNMKEGR